MTHGENNRRRRIRYNNDTVSIPTAASRTCLRERERERGWVQARGWVLGSVLADKHSLVRLYIRIYYYLLARMCISKCR